MFNDWDTGALKSRIQCTSEDILATLEHTGWNKSKSSEILGIERSTLDRKLKRCHVPRPLTE